MRRHPDMSMTTARTTLFGVLIVFGMGFGAVRWVEAQAPGASQPTPSPAPSVTPTEEEVFVFSPRGRRDPFEPPYFRVGSERKSDKDAVGTRDTISRAAKILDDLTQAAKTKNTTHFKTLYEELNRLLETKFTSEELKIYAMEIGRRARELKKEVDGYEETRSVETVLQSVEKRVMDLQVQIQRGQFEQVREIYQGVVRDLTGLQASDEVMKRRRDGLLLRAGNLVSQADAAIARDLFKRGEALLGEMKDKLQNEKFEDVIAEFQNLKNRLGALNLTDEQMKVSRDKLLKEAAEVSRQAEIGAVKRELKKADALIAKMSAALDANDFAAVSAGYGKVQELLKALNVADPALGERKAETLEKAASIDRSAKTRAEFQGREVKINGIAWSPTSPAAIINGRSYGEGDALDDVTRIQKIEEHSVTFRYKGESVAKPATP